MVQAISGGADDSISGGWVYEYAHMGKAMRSLVGTGMGMAFVMGMGMLAMGG